MVHLNPNSVLHIATYIHLCEAFLGIRPHFNLFRFQFILKAYKNKVVGGAGLQLRGGRSQRYINLPLKTSLRGWHEEWFYISNPSPSLPPYDGHAPVVRESWSSLPSNEDMTQVSRLLEILDGRKGEGITGVGVVLSFINRRVQPVKDRVHPSNEYSGPCDPTRESPILWTEEEMIRRARTLFAGDAEITNAGCPPAYSLKRPADEVSLPSLFGSCLRVAFDSIGTDHALSKAFASNPPLLDRKRKGKVSSDAPKGKRPHGPSLVPVGGPKVGDPMPVPPPTTAAPTAETRPLHAPPLKPTS